LGCFQNKAKLVVKKVSKDQAIGGAIFIVCVVLIIGYIAGLFLSDSISSWLKLDAVALRYWLVAVPVLIAFVAVLGIGAWIGWTMATTPPPRPIEEIEAEEKQEEEKAEAQEEKAEEKKK
jgi:predicted DNA-binding transcriptional regulator